MSNITDCKPRFPGRFCHHNLCALQLLLRLGLFHGQADHSLRAGNAKKTHWFTNYFKDWLVLYFLRYPGTRRKTWRSGPCWRSAFPTVEDTSPPLKCSITLMWNKVKKNQVSGASDLSVLQITLSWINHPKEMLKYFSFRRNDANVLLDSVEWTREDTVFAGHCFKAMIARSTNRIIMEVYVPDIFRKGMQFLN